MSLYGSAVECGLHCLLSLADAAPGAPPSSRDLAEFQGVSPAFVGKLFTRLEKAGIVASAEGVAGGFRLARPAAAISVLDVVDALEGDKPLFRCREIRRNCVLYADSQPDWAAQGTCRIHHVMLAAERSMRATLAGQTIAGLASEVEAKQPARQQALSQDWFAGRRAARRTPRRETAT